MYRAVRRLVTLVPILAAITFEEYCLHGCLITHSWAYLNGIAYVYIIISMLLELCLMAMQHDNRPIAPRTAIVSSIIFAWLWWHCASIHVVNAGLSTYLIYLHRMREVNGEFRHSELIWIESIVLSVVGTYSVYYTQGISVAVILHTLLLFGIP